MTDKPDTTDQQRESKRRHDKLRGTCRSSNLSRDEKLKARREDPEAFDEAQAVIDELDEADAKLTEATAVPTNQDAKGRFVKGNKAALGNSRQMDEDEIVREIRRANLEASLKMHKSIAKRPQKWYDQLDDYQSVQLVKRFIDTTEATAAVEAGPQIVFRLMTRAGEIDLGTLADANGQSGEPEVYGPQPLVEVSPTEPAAPQRDEERAPIPAPPSPVDVLAELLSTPEGCELVADKLLRVRHGRGAVAAKILEAERRAAERDDLRNRERMMNDGAAWSGFGAPQVPLGLLGYVEDDE